MQIVKELIEKIDSAKGGKVDISRIKKELCKKYKIKDIPSNIEILNNLSKEQREKYRVFFITKPTRTGSGVAPLALMTAPFACPHGKCTYCPGGPKSVFGDVPQSYTGREPASMRAARANYDPYLQVFNRLEQYIVLGQIPEKCDVIVMGGTFPGLDQSYQEDFILNIFKAMNDFSKLFFSKKAVKGTEFNFEKFKKFFLLPGDIDSPERLKVLNEKILKLKVKGNSKLSLSKKLEKEQKINETANIRCIGLTIETKPDWGLLKHGNELLKLGCTRVELGIQTTDNNTLKLINRGHDLKDTINSVKILKDLGFKINAHLMPGLPNSTRESDIKMLNEIFQSQNYRPDMLKIYPCLVMKGTYLYEQFKQGKFKPLSTLEAADIISEFKKNVPRYVRIMRVNRDIPTYRTEAGIDQTNLRQVVDNVMKQKGYTCNCIRCREAKEITGKTHLEVEEYDASEGKEFFISINDEKDKIIGFCRLRIPSQVIKKEKPLREEFTNKSAIIRELHVYSGALGLGTKSKSSNQHKGYGKMLVEAAEKITKKNKLNKLLVISGVGVREYYKKLGYKQDGPYVSKILK